jgi:hypothetical protein
VLTALFLAVSSLRIAQEVFIPSVRLIRRPSIELVSNTSPRSIFNLTDTARVTRLLRPGLTARPLMETAKSWAFSHDHEITTMCICHPYLFTFSLERADIWRLDTGDVPRHVAELADLCCVPELDLTRGVVVDAERDVVIISLMPTPPQILTFSLTDGTLLDSWCLDGWIDQHPSPYLNGRILLATCEDEDDEHPDGVSRITSCEWDPSGGQESVQHVHFPMDLQQRAKRKVDLAPIVLTATGDIIGTASESYTNSMFILQWRGPNVRTGQEPDARLELSLSLEGGHLIHTESFAQMNDDTFLLCVRESRMDVVHNGRTSQIVIYAIDVQSLTVRWRAEPIFGLHCTIDFVPALGVAVAIGRNPPQNETWIAVLNKDTGAYLRMEVIDHHSEAGVPVLTCAVSQSAENPALVVVFEDGDYVVSDLHTFAEEGLARYEDDGSLKVTKAFGEEQVTIQRAVVGNGTLVMLLAAEAEEATGGSRMHCISW